jgi:hypothetical protein
MSYSEGDIKAALTVSLVQSIAKSIDEEIARLTALKPKIPERIEHIKKHIVFKYHVEIVKHKNGTYRDTDFINGEYQSASYTEEKTGSHYEVSVSEYASGTVSQRSRQHEDLTLTGWYKIVPNTAIQSWTITGKID